MSAKTSTKTFPQTFASSALAVILSAILVSPTFAGDREQAKRIHDRLVGTPPSDACLTQLQNQVSTGPAGAKAAAMDAITNDGGGDNCTGKEFYRVTLKNFVTPWTNEEQTVFATLNDYTATVIGMLRDDKDFRGILSHNILYVGTASGPIAAYANDNNDHYMDLENNGVDLQADLQEKLKRKLLVSQQAPLPVFSRLAQAPRPFSSMVQIAPCSASPCSIICVMTWNRSKTPATPRIAFVRTSPAAPVATAAST